MIIILTITLFCGLGAKASCVGKNVIIGINKPDIGFDQMSIHAEKNVIEKFQNYGHVKSSKKWNLLVIRVSKSGQYIGASRPCQHCIGHLRKSNIRISHVYYTQQDGSIERETLSQMTGGYISTGHKLNILKHDNLV